MHISHLLGAAILCGGIGLFYGAGNTDTGSTASPIAPPPASGHFVLVIEGDRDQIAITHASHKVDPWAGVQKGLQSRWALSIRDARGTELRRIPLDMSKFDLRPEQQGRPLRVEGCIVRDSRIGMLANAPSLADAASYVFLRDKTIVGTVDAATVNQLAGGGR